MNKNYESNIWKYFLYLLTNRRNFIALLGIYFMTLPDAKAFQIGLYTVLGSIVSFVMEIPSGYISDTIGHKKTLIISKFFLFLSTISFIIGENFYYFVLGSIFLSLAFSFQSGTIQAFIHNTLIELKRENEYTKIVSKFSGNVSLISAFMILLLPFLTEINFLLPFYFYLFIDLIGLIITISFVNVENKIENREERKTIKQIVKESKDKKFFSVAIFSASIIGFMIGTFTYREVYLESLGLPIIFMGFAMSLSRFVWFGVGHYAYLIEEKLSMKKHFLIEMILFTLTLLLVAYFSNPYLVILIAALMNGYMWGREPIITNYILKNYISDKRYKATILSLKGFILEIMKMISILLMAILTIYSYKFGYFVSGLVLFLILSSSYYFIRKH